MGPAGILRQRVCMAGPGIQNSLPCLWQERKKVLDGVVAGGTEKLSRMDGLDPHMHHLPSSCDAEAKDDTSKSSSTSVKKEGWRIMSRRVGLGCSSVAMPSLFLAYGAEHSYGKRMACMQASLFPQPF
eukprot:1146490-Pelagomonas_calceolata.AAC.10